MILAEKIDNSELQDFSWEKDPNKFTSMKNFYHLLYIFLISACQNGEIKKDDNVDTSKVSVENVDVELPLNEEKIVENEEEAEFVEYPSAIDYDNTYLYELLTVGMMHGGEAAKDIEKKTWYGIFSDSDSVYSIRKVNPIVENAFDAVVDEAGGDSTGVLVSLDEPGNAIMLFSSKNQFANDTLNYAKSVPKQILANESYAFKFGGNSYKLFATGIQSDEYDGWNGTSNYRLYIEEIGKDLASQQTLLVSKEYFDDSGITILFIGDIDKDSKIDVLLDASSHYNIFEPVLFLSTEAVEYEVVRMASLAMYSGC